MSEINLNTNLSSCIINNAPGVKEGKAPVSGSSGRDAVNEIVMLEWQAFDKVQNEGGREVERTVENGRAIAKEFFGEFVARLRRQARDAIDVRIPVQNEPARRSR